MVSIHSFIIMISQSQQHKHRQCREALYRSRHTTTAGGGERNTIEGCGRTEVGGGGPDVGPEPPPPYYLPKKKRKPGLRPGRVWPTYPKYPVCKFPKKNQTFWQRPFFAKMILQKITLCGNPFCKKESSYVATVLA